MMMMMMDEQEQQQNENDDDYFIILPRNNCFIIGGENAQITNYNIAGEVIIIVLIPTGTRYY